MSYVFVFQSVHVEPRSSFTHSLFQKNPNLFLLTCLSSSSRSYVLQKLFERPKPQKSNQKSVSVTYTYLTETFLTMLWSSDHRTISKHLAIVADHFFQKGSSGIPSVVSTSCFRFVSSERSSSPLPRRTVHAAKDLGIHK